MLEEMLASPEARAIFVVGVGSLLSIPVAIVGDLLARLPNKYLAPERMPAILAFAGFIGGGILAGLIGIPRDIGMEVGAIAGGFSAKAPRFKKNGGT